MFNNTIAKAIIHILNGSADLTTKNIVIDFSQDIVIKGFHVYGLIQEQVNSDGIVCAVYCNNGNNCDENGNIEVAPDANKIGILYFERYDKSFDTDKTIIKDNYMFSEDFRIVAWYNKCRLGFDKCCEAYPLLIAKLLQKLSFCSFDITPETAALLSCEAGGIAYKRVTIKALDKHLVMNNDIFARFDYDKTLNNTPYESFALNFNVTYTLDLPCVELPNISENNICNCI